MTTIAEMERQLQAHREKAAKVSSLENDFHNLIDQGLLRMDAGGNVHCVQSWEEHQELR